MMDLSIEKCLKEIASGTDPLTLVAAVATACPAVEPFLVPPSLATCHQGAQQRPVFVLAERADTVLYADGKTHQFGVAFQSAARRDHVFAGREYPSLESAALMFLTDTSAPEPD